MDDQAETVLINLLRGAGLDGLAGMRPGPEHPLLAIRRADTHALCGALGLEPVRDPTNDDRRFVRNRVRHELLPLANALSGRDLVPVLARQATLLGDEADFLDTLAGSLDPTDAASLRAAPRALARRAMRRWLRQGRDPHPPTSPRWSASWPWPGARWPATEVAPGKRVRRSRGRLSAVPVTPGASGSVGAR